MEANYTIIIPHYNIPELLVRCLKSIPIREDIQVIVVDDCSPDYETYNDRYTELSRPYLELYQPPKGGSAGRARNVGLEHAKGKWILFADADDFFSANFIDLLEKYCKEDADVIHFKADSIDEVTHAQSDRHIDLNNSIDAYLSGDLNALDASLWYTAVCGKIISKSLIEKYHIRFDETMVSNDVMFATKAYCNARKILFVNEVLYIITTRENSLHDSKGKDANRFIEQQRVQLRFHRYITERGIKRVPPCTIRLVYETYKKWGVAAGYNALKMVLKEHALLYGLGDYIKRHFKR